MSLLQSITGFIGEAGRNLVESVVDTVDRFVHTRDEAEQVKREIRNLEAEYRESERRFQLHLQQQLLEREKEIEQTVRTELGAKTAVMLAELNQDDAYTRRARPTILYAGLAVVALELFGLRPYILSSLPAAPGVIDGSNTIFQTFLWVWAGVAGVYTIGRSGEKLGAVRRTDREHS